MCQQVYTSLIFFAGSGMFTRLRPFAAASASAVSLRVGSMPSVFAQLSLSQAFAPSRETCRCSYHLPLILN